jgi:hypothetical protein
MEIRYRQNRKEDCNWVAGLIHIAFGGVAGFSCDLIPEMTFLQSVASNLERHHSPIPIEMLFQEILNGFVQIHVHAGHLHGSGN